MKCGAASGTGNWELVTGTVCAGESRAKLDALASLAESVVDENRKEGGLNEIGPAAEPRF